MVYILLIALAFLLGHWWPIAVAGILLALNVILEEV